MPEVTVFSLHAELLSEESFAVLDRSFLSSSVLIQFLFGVSEVTSFSKLTVTEPHKVSADSCLVLVRIDMLAFTFDFYSSFSLSLNFLSLFKCALYFVLTTVFRHI